MFTPKNMVSQIRKANYRRGSMHPDRPDIHTVGAPLHKSKNVINTHPYEPINKK